MNWRDKVKLLHPDSNGGDASRTQEFAAMMTQRQAKRRLCNCGCGRVVHRKGRTFFFEQLCHLRYRYRRYVALLLAVFCLALSPAIKDRRTVMLAWDAYPDASTNINIHSTTDTNLGGWIVMATVPARITNVSFRVDGQQRWFALSAVNSNGQSYLSAPVRLPAFKRLRSPKDSE